MTFICHGKLALYLAEKFIRIWTSKANDKEHGLVRYGLPANNEFTACAGIAIAKTKYPFIVFIRCRYKVVQWLNIRLVKKWLVD